MPRVKEYVNLLEDANFMAKLQNIDKTTANKLLKAVGENGFDEPTLNERLMSYFTERNVKLRFNEWEKKPYYVLENGVYHPFDDDFDDRVLNSFERKGVSIPRDKYRTIISGEAQDDKFHPAKEYFLNAKSLYDHVDYISIFCTKYISHDHAPLVIDGVTHDFLVFSLRSWMRLVVGKLFDMKQNFCFTIDGKQDLGKTSFLSWLCPNIDWFNSEKLTSLDKDVRGRTTQKLIWEIPELDSTTRKSDVSELKDFLTKVWEIWRAAYGHHDRKAAVTASYCASLNVNSATGFLADPTGNRRFCVLTAKHIDFAYQEEFNVNHLWQQAAFEYFQDPKWSLPKQFKEYQANLNECAYTLRSIEEEIVSDYVYFSGNLEDKVACSTLREELQKATERKFNNHDYAKINTELVKRGAKRIKPRVDGKQGSEFWVGVKLRYWTVQAEGDRPAYEIIKKIDSEWIDQQEADAAENARLYEFAEQTAKPAENLTLFDDKK